MRLAVAGGTGTVGRFVVETARRAGHDVVVMSRGHGVDVVTGTGLEAALRGADAVIDVSNGSVLSRRRSVQFFDTATRNLVRAEQAAGVGHHIALSIVGIDRVPLGYYAGKRRQEEVLARDEVPWTVLRATQFHEFPGQLLDRVKGPFALVPRMRSATVAAQEVAEHLVALAAGPARGRAPDLGGPQAHAMPDLVRRVAAAAGRRAAVIPLRLPGRLGAELAGGGLLPDEGSTLGSQSFDEWLAARGV